MYIFYITTNIIMLLKKNEINHVYIDILRLHVYGLSDLGGKIRHGSNTIAQE